MILTNDNIIWNLLKEKFSVAFPFPYSEHIPSFTALTTVTIRT
jgi:hypothetical protein